MCSNKEVFCLKTTLKKRISKRYIQYKVSATFTFVTLLRQCFCDFTRSYLTYIPNSIQVFSRLLTISHSADKVSYHDLIKTY